MVQITYVRILYLKIYEYLRHEIELFGVLMGH